MTALVLKFCSLILENRKQDSTLFVFVCVCMCTCMHVQEFFLVTEVQSTMSPSVCLDVSKSGFNTTFKEIELAELIVHPHES